MIVMSQNDLVKNKTISLNYINSVLCLLILHSYVIYSHRISKINKITIQNIIVTLQNNVILYKTTIFDHIIIDFCILTINVNILSHKTPLKKTGQKYEITKIDSNITNNVIMYKTQLIKCDFNVTKNAVIHCLHHCCILSTSSLNN